MLEKISRLKTGAKRVAYSTAGAVMFCPVAIAFATDTLDPDVKTSIVGGFTSSGGMIKDIVILGVAATISAIALTGGAKYALKWVKGIFAKAS